MLLAAAPNLLFVIGIPVLFMLASFAVCFLLYQVLGRVFRP